MTATRILLTALAVLYGSPLVADEPARPQMSLDGQWQFKLDPQDEGSAGQWFAREATFPDQIMVPGNWQAQGFGEPRGIAKHDYQGKAWYRRGLTVPAAWQGERVWLRLECVCNCGEVFLDGAQVGRVDSFITPREFDITERIRLGCEQRLDVLVDSKTPADSPYIGMLQFLVASGGITSHVRLEARPDPQLDRIRLRAEPGLKGVLASVTARRAKAGPTWQGRCRVRVLEANDALATEGEAALAFAPDSSMSGTAELRLAFPELRPWSPEDPHLYRVEVTLLDATGARDGKTIRTGFRTLVTDANTGNLLLNGRPLFLRGCGYDSLEPIHGSPPPDKAIYVERLRHLKNYGFNAIRSLAHTPLREFFEAADEVGMLLQTEGEWFLAATPMQPGTAAILQAQVPRMIREFENHPAWYSFSCFNEAFNAHLDPVKQAYIRNAHDTFRALKPDHFFVASDGGGDQWPTDLISDRSAMGRADGSAASTDSPQQVFRGQIEEVALFHRALDQAAVRQLAAELPEASPARSAAARLQAAVRWSQRVFAPGVSLADQAPQSLPARGQALTVAVWVRPEGFAKNDWGTFFSCGAAEPGRALLLALDGEQGDGHLCIGRYFDNILRSQRALVADRWNHVALTYDGRWIRLWMDGEQDAELEAGLDIPPRDIAVGRLVDRVLRAPADYASRPHVWHEFDNTYIAPLPDLDKESRLTGAMTQAWVLEPHRRRIESYGLLPRYPELRQRSIARYREYVKSVYERARQMPRLDGYAWWVVSDIPGGVETDVTDYGILDMLYQPEKFPDPAWFRQFNRDSVLLIDADTDQRVLAAGEPKKVQISLSHFGAAPVENGELSWKISADATTLREGRIDRLQAAPATITLLGQVTCGPFDFVVPKQLTFFVELNSAACRQSNQWQFWVFPAQKRDCPQSGVVNLTGEPLLDTRYHTGSSHALKGKKVALAKTLTPELLAWTQAGGSAILLERNEPMSSVSRPGVVGHSFSVPSGILRQAGALPYWPLWLRCDVQWVERHPALGDFPHDGVSGFQFMRLFSSGVPMVDFTPRDALTRKHFQPIVAGMSLIPWTEDASRFNYALAYGAMLSECRLGAGRVLVCNLWTLDGIRRGFPEAGYLLDCLVSYAATAASDAQLPALSAEDAQAMFHIEN